MVIKNYFKFLLDLHYYVEVKRGNFSIGGDEWQANWRLIYIYLLLGETVFYILINYLNVSYLSEIYAFVYLTFPLHGYFLSMLISRLLYKRKSVRLSYFNELSKRFDKKYEKNAGFLYWLFVLYETLILVLIIFIAFLNQNIIMM